MFVNSWHTWSKILKDPHKHKYLKQKSIEIFYNPKRNLKLANIVLIFDKCHHPDKGTYRDADASKNCMTLTI